MTKKYRTKENKRVRHKMDPGATVEGAEGNGGHPEYIARKAYHMRS
jgi:hypothetical protein